jgi:cytochrome b
VIGDRGDGDDDRGGGVVVWDPLVRIAHWSLASAVIAVWSTGHWFHPLHHALGYAAAGIVLLRIVWGVVGARHARFGDFVRSPSNTRRYAASLLRGEEPDHLGHNPLGGWMILALLSTVALTSFTGWLYTTDAFWGYGWLEQTHAALAWLLATLVAGHLLGVIVMSLRERRNLAWSMVTGRKRWRKSIRA